MKRAPDYLALALRRYPPNPAFALWRAIELRKLAPLHFEEPILDLGCGDGRFAEMLLGPGRRLFGLDLIAGDAASANANAAYVAAVRGDATHLPFRSGAFASVLSNCVLEHIPDDCEVVREMARVVRPGGSVAFTVPSPGLHQGLYGYQKLIAQGRDEEAEEYLRELDERLVHHHYRTADEWRDILAGSGIDTERIEPYLPGPAIATWDRIDAFLNQSACAVQYSRKLALYILTPQFIRFRLLHWFLRRFYRMNGAEGDLFGCWLVVGRRRE